MKKIKNIVLGLWERRKVEVTESPVTTPQYDSLDMPLSVFIDAIVDGKMDAIKDFEKIYIEFCEAVGGRELVQSIEEAKELIELETRVTIAHCGIQMLRLRPSKEIFDEMLKLGYNSSVHEYAEDKVEQYIKQITPFVELDNVDAQVMRNRRKQVTNGEKYTRNYFSAMLNEFLVVFKAPLDESISLRRYCQMVVRYKMHKQTLEKTNT